MVQLQKFKCQAPDCGEWSDVELHYDPSYAAQTVCCEKCGTKHFAIQLPTPDGQPVQFKIMLPGAV